MVGKYPVITLCGSIRSEIEYVLKNGKNSHISGALAEQMNVTIK